MTLDLDELSNLSDSKVYNLLASTFDIPSVKVLLQVARPVVYLTTEEKFFGRDKSGNQLAIRTNNANNNRLFAEGRHYGGAG